MRLVYGVRCRFLSFAFMFLMVGAGCDQITQWRDQKTFKRYQVKSGMIEYMITGAQRGTELVYFDQWGVRESRYRTTQIDMDGNMYSLRSLTIMDEDWIYTIDLNQMSGTRMANPLIKRLKEIAEALPEGNPGEEMMRRGGAESQGDKEFLGRTCSVWKIKGISESWIWKNISLRSVVKLKDETMAYTAKSISLNLPVKSEKFKVPEGIVLELVELAPPGKEPKEN